jgi:2'-5' RNA ligase
MSSPYRYAVYLIPPYPVSRKVSEIHHLLEKQFGLKAGGRFQVHATIKGFFKKTPGPLDPIIKRLDAVFVDQRPLLVSAEGLRRDEIGFGIDLSQLNGQLNQPLLDFRERVVDAVRPFIAPDCDFVDSDLGPPFRAHLTLAFRDIPPDAYDQIVAWTMDAQPFFGPFIASDFHFLEFHSNQWEGAWWEDLTWRLIKAWRLQGS